MSAHLERVPSWGAYVQLADDASDRVVKLGEGCEIAAISHTNSCVGQIKSQVQKAQQQRVRGVIGHDRAGPRKRQEAAQSK